MKIFRHILTYAVLATGLISSYASAETIRLNLWEQDSPEFGEELKLWIKIYEKRNPGVKIVAQHYGNEELRTRYLRSSVTGDGADIVYGPNDLAGVFVTAQVIKNLDDLIKENPDLDPNAVKVTKLQGKNWGYPVSVGNHLFLYYNKKLVDKAPASFEEIVKLGKDFMKKDKNNYGLAMYQSEPFWFLPFLAGFDGWPLKSEGSSVNVSLDTKASRQALSYLVDLKDKHKILPADCDYECAKNLFLTERAPFHISGDWELMAFSKHFGENLGFEALPIIEASGKPANTIVGGRYLFLNAELSGKKLEAAKDFVRFISQAAIQVRLATKLQRIPASLAARKHPQVQGSKQLAQLTETIKYAKASPSDVEMRAAWDGLRIMVQRAMSGKESVEQACKTGQKAATEALQALKDKKRKVALIPC